MTRARAPATADGPALRVAHGNLFLGNRGASRAAAYANLMSTDPDLLVLAEAMPALDRPACTLQRWPYQVWQAQPLRPHQDQVALLSRHPILSHQTGDVDGQAYLIATVDVAGRHLHVLAIHAPSPQSGDQSRARRRQLQHLATTVQDLVSRDPAPVVALGDFNCTTRSPWWRALREADLRTAAVEPATWPSNLGDAGIAIDHLLGRDLAVAPPRAITLPGSDHRGLATTVAFLR